MPHYPCIQSLDTPQFTNIAFKWGNDNFRCFMTVSIVVKPHFFMLATKAKKIIERFSNLLR